MKSQNIHVNTPQSKPKEQKMMMKDEMKVILLEELIKGWKEYQHQNQLTIPLSRRVPRTPHQLPLADVQLTPLLRLILILQILKQSLELRTIGTSHGIVILYPLLLHEYHRGSPMQIVQIDRTHYIPQIEYILTRHLLPPPFNIPVIVLPPQLWIVILLVEHGLNEERIEEV